MTPAADAGGSVYLAGGILGLSDEEVGGWRRRAITLLAAAGLGALDPMVRDYRGREDDCAQEIVDLDKRDILEAAAVIVNAVRPSWGTAMEVIFAWERGIPVVAWVPAGTVVSPWLRYHSVAVVTTLEEAVAEVVRRRGRLLRGRR